MGGAFTYNTIVISPEPRGRFIDAIISGTPKPGVVMEVKAATEAVGGNFTYQVYQPGGDGQNPVGAIAVLCEDQLQGKTVTDAYVTGSLCRLYFPLPGDELLMQLQLVAGTADTHAIGDKLIIDNSTGTLIDTTGSPECEPFVCLETLAELSVDTLAHVQYTGH